MFRSGFGEPAHVDVVPIRRLQDAAENCDPERPTQFASQVVRTGLLLRSAALGRQRRTLPFAPGPCVEPALASREPGAMQDDAGGHARSAVGDEFTVRQLREGLVPRRVARARNSAETHVDLVRLAAKATGGAAVNEHECGIAEPEFDLLHVRRVADALAWHKRLRFDIGFAGRERAAPRVDPPVMTAQSSWPKCRSRHHNRSAPPVEPYATTKTPSAIPARPAAAANRTADGSG